MRQIKQVVILCTMINTFGQPGFYNSQEVGLARALAGKGCHVTILKGLYGNDVAEGTQRIEEHVSLRYIRMKHLGANGYFETRMFPKETDAVLCFSDQQQFIPHVAKYCKKHGIAFIPYIGTAHSEFTGSLKGRIMNALFQAGTLRLYKKNPVIAKTPSARDELCSLGVPENHIHIANVGLDLALMKKDFESADRTAIRKKYGFGEGDIVLLGIARMVEYKNPLAFVEVLRMAAPGCKLLMVGNGPLKNSVQQKAEEYGLRDRYVQIDRVPYSEMWELYTAADYYLNMNPQEIFGMAIMEAMYYKTSVIALDAQGPRMILNGLEGHHICRSVEEAAEKLKERYPDDNLLQQGQDAVKTRLSWNTCADTFLELAGYTAVR